MRKWFKSLLETLFRVAHALESIARSQSERWMREHTTAYVQITVYDTTLKRVWQVLGGTVNVHRNKEIVFRQQYMPPINGYIDIALEGCDTIGISKVQCSNISYPIEGYVRRYRIEDATKFVAGVQLRIELNNAFYENM